MKQINIAIIGAGNISNTRHIPAIKKVEKLNIVGVVGVRNKNVDRTAKKHNIKNTLVVEDGNFIEIFKNTEWFINVDAVVVGVPPQDHYAIAKAALINGKHVLVEKPMMMTEAECEELIKLAKKSKKIFYVMHNFQYADKMLKLNEIIKSNKYGEIISIHETQFTNHDRRLPVWYNDLPFGLFYDEAAHFIYLLERHAGNIMVTNSYAVYDEDKDTQTPITLTVNANAGRVPVTMVLNFHAPICEWYYIVSFKKRIVLYDFFKDILIDLPTDNEHLAKDILRNSISQTFQYWTQFIVNGFKMVTGNLLYGHDKVLQSFADAISGKAPDINLVAEQGRKNVIVINEIVNKANSRK